MTIVAVVALTVLGVLLSRVPVTVPDTTSTIITPTVTTTLPTATTTTTTTTTTTATTTVPPTTVPVPPNCTENLPVLVMTFINNTDGEGLTYVPTIGKLLRTDGLSAGQQLWIYVNITNDGNGGFTAVENPSLTTTYDAAYQRGHGFEITAAGYDPITSGIIVSDRLCANLASWGLNAVPIADYASFDPGGPSFGPLTWHSLGGYYVDYFTGLIYGVTKQFFDPPSIVIINRTDPLNTTDIPVFFADAAVVVNLVAIARSPVSGNAYVMYQGPGGSAPRKMARVNLQTGELFRTCFENITVTSQAQINTMTFDNLGSVWFSAGGTSSTLKLYAMRTEPELLLT